MSNYFDPSTALPDPSTYAQHGPFGITMPSFLGTQAAANRRETVAPFLQRAGQEEELNLQKLQTDIGEYTGPEATALRSQQRQTQTIESKQQALSAPIKGDWERSDWAKKTALNPLQTREEKAKLTQLIFEHENASARDALEMIASQRDNMAKAKSPAEQATIRDNVVKQWQQKYKDKPLPPQLQNVDPKFYDQAYDAVVQSAQHLRDIQKEREVQTATTGRTAMEQTGQTQRTEINAASARTPEQTVNWAREQLRTKKLSPQQRQSIELQLDAAHDQLAESELKGRFKATDVVDRAILESMAKQKIESGEMTAKQAAEWISSAQERHQADIDSQKAKMRKTRGFTMSTLRNQPGSQGKTDAEIRSQAKSRGITVLE